MSNWKIIDKYATLFIVYGMIINVNFDEITIICKNTGVNKPNINLMICIVCYN
ncbi:hypothetical protein ACJDTP_14650 [Clostridium sp. WILCCON 0112]|uniref:Uncharacterized protein n=1 Tax=Candidatus Clostridium helianthi TaxID=3381660 RepID=A0ABW8S614_9CLOT